VKGRTHGTTRLGELIAEVFDEAARHGADPREVSRLVTQTVRYLVRGSGRISVRLRATGA
jgi:hypothetical protein